MVYGTDTIILRGHLGTLSILAVPGPLSARGSTRLPPGSQPCLGGIRPHREVIAKHRVFIVHHKFYISPVLRGLVATEKGARYFKMHDI